MSFEDAVADSRVKATPGLHVGPVVARRWTRRIRFQAEALYVERGFDSDDEWLALHYLEVPLSLVIEGEGLLRPHASVGSFVGFEVACTQGRVPGLGTIGCDDPLATVSRRTLDIGWLLGVGVGHPVRRGVLSLELRRTGGLRDISRSEPPDGAVRHRGTAVSLVYRRGWGDP